jgi:hypothetical protein
MVTHFSVFFSLKGDLLISELRNRMGGEEEAGTEAHVK